MRMIDENFERAYAKMEEVLFDTMAESMGGEDYVPIERGSPLLRNMAVRAVHTSLDFRDTIY